MENGGQKSKVSLDDLLAHRDEMSPELEAELKLLLDMDAQVSSEEELQKKSEECFNLWVSRDKMSVMLSLIAKESQAIPSIEDIMDEVMRQELSCPIDIQLLEEKLPTLTSDEELCIGRGVEAVDGKDSWFEFHVDDPSEMILPTDTDRVDYRDHHRIIDVRKDQELLTVHPPTEPVTGRDVYGSLLHGRQGAKKRMYSGENTILMKDNGTLYATCDGCLVRKGDRVSVQELLILPHGVNMETGNIETHSRVLIRGTVADGFSVKSLQDIVVEGDVEAATLISEQGRIHIDGGIMGKNKAIIRSKTSIYCHHASQSILSCEGDIEVHDSLLHCTITCGKRLRVVSGQHGVIMGGSIRIRERIEVKRIGSPSEPRTDFIMGFDFKYEEQLTEIDLQRHQLKMELETAKLQMEEISRHTAGSNLEKQKLELELKKEWLLLKVKNETLIKEIKAIEEIAFCEEECELIVYRELYANTMIHLYRVQRRVNEDMCGVRVLINSKKQEMSFEELGA